MGMRRFGRGVAVAALVAAVLGLLPGAAQANVPVGSGSILVGPQLSSTLKSSVYASWSNSTRVMTAWAEGYNMTTNNCETVWFDWTVDNGHFDIRGVRQCHLGSTRHTGVSTESPPSGFTFLGMQKFSGCYGANNTKNGCENHPSATQTLADVSPIFSTANWGLRHWLKISTGQTAYFDGGNSRLFDA